MPSRHPLRNRGPTRVRIPATRTRGRASPTPERPPAPSSPSRPVCVFRASRADRTLSGLSAAQELEQQRLELLSAAGGEACRR